MKEQIPQPAPISRTLQGKSREANTASLTNVLQAYKNGISQRQEVDEDELLQGKFETAQRAELEDDELLQGKFETVQRAELEDDELLQGKFETTQRKESPNNTGLPDNLKAGVEQLSGLDMSDIKVHFNSSKPASVQAYAYTQGTDIHVAPGQEKHLGHEAWHVAQQKQGRVQPTTTVGGMPVNDNSGLENEADVMGGKAVQMAAKLNSEATLVPFPRQKVVQAKLSSEMLNVAGESHNEYEMPGNERLRSKEREFAKKNAGGAYWTEEEFKVTTVDVGYSKNIGESGDPVRLQFLQCVELISSLCGNHLLELEPNIPEDAIILKNMVLDAILLIQGPVLKRHKAMLMEHKSNVRILSDSQLSAVLEIANEVDEMKTTCKEIYDILDKGQLINDNNNLIKILLMKFNRLKFNRLRNIAINLNNNIQIIAAKINDNDAVTQENVRESRSKEMHNSAQVSYETKGIWKVGNNHIIDIDKYKNNLQKPKYNLIDKNDFNKERDAFIPNMYLQHDELEPNQTDFAEWSD